MTVALFDFDGVVVDTEGQYTQFWGEMGRIYCPSVPDFAYRIKGQTLFQIFDAWIPSQTDRDIIKQRLYAFESTMQFPFIDGVCDYVRLLHDNGVKCAIVTSSDNAKMSNALAALPRLNVDFDAILTADSFTHSKPHPECYLAGAAHFDTTPQYCVVFEDSLNGIRAGKSAGMFTVGLATTNPVDVIKPLCDEVIDNFVGYRRLSL